MRLVIISDTHNRQQKLRLPDGDCLLHCGDLSEGGSGFEILAALRWMNTLPYKHKIWIAGNHDIDLDDFPDFEEYVVKKFPKLTYLKDSFVIVDGVKVYGSPWTRKFNNWGFELGEKELKRKWEIIPEDTDILMTHTPPMGVLDKTYNNFSCGCEELYSRVCALKPKYHMFSHIHEARSIDYRSNPSTMFINASIVNYSFNSLHKAFSVEYESGEIIEF